MKKNILTIALCLAALSSFSQTKVVKDQLTGDYVSVPMPSKSAYEPTGEFFRTSKGERLPIFATLKGKEFVLLTSKKTGKEYRKYITK